VAAAFLAAPLPGQTIIGSKPDAPAVPEAALKNPVFAPKETVFSITLESSTATYRRESPSQGYRQVGWTAETHHQWSVGGRTERVPQPDAGQPAPETEPEASIRLLRHGQTLFIKIQSSQPAIRSDSKIRFSFEGTYELTPTEGTWEDYEAGRPFKGKIADKDRERYLAEQTKALQNPEFLEHHARLFKSKLVANFESIVKNPESIPGGAEAVEKARASVRRSLIAVAPIFEGAPELYAFEGDALTVTCPHVEVSLRFRATLPATGEGTPFDEPSSP